MTNSEIDIVMATKVMGWKVVEDENNLMGAAAWAIAQNGEKRFLWYLNEKIYSAEVRWCPTDDILAAWDVVERFTRAGRKVEITLHESATVVIDSVYRAESGIPTMAICLAALKAVNGAKI